MNVGTGIIYAVRRVKILDLHSSSFRQLLFDHFVLFAVIYNFRNVPYDWINKQKSNQHWLKKEGEKFFFPGGGTMFPNGVGKYVDLMEDLIPEMKDGTIRTAIDTGCGVSLLFVLLSVLSIADCGK
jgi:hypothetical protein